MFGKDNKPHNLIGLWTFDDKFAADHSGLRNFIQPAPKAGPAAGRMKSSIFVNHIFQVEKVIQLILMEQT